MEKATEVLLEWACPEDEEDLTRFEYREWDTDDCDRRRFHDCLWVTMWMIMLESMEQVPLTFLNYTEKQLKKFANKHMEGNVDRAIEKVMDFRKHWQPSKVVPIWDMCETENEEDKKEAVHQHLYKLTLAFHRMRDKGAFNALQADSEDQMSDPEDK